MLTPAELAVVKGADLYDWQIETLEAFGREWPTSLLTCNGAGKTAVVAARAVDWFFYAFPRGKLVATSGSFNQLQNQLWPSVKQHLPSSARVTNGTSPCTIVTREGGKGVGFSTNDPGRAEGFHPTIHRDVDPVMILVDEGKTVPDGIFNAFDRCTVRYVLYISSCGAPRGRFYETFHSLGSEYYTIKADYTRCTHISREKVDRDRRIYGEDHPIFRSMHLAEFTVDTDRLVLDAQRLARAIEGQPPVDHRGERVAFCDFAAGRDENALAVRRGNEVRLVDAWTEKDTVQACRQFIRLFEAEGLKPGQIWGDADGLGTVMIDQLAEMGWPISRFHGGQASSQPEEYANLIAEIWHVGAREIERGRIHVGQLDPQTSKQLTTRRSEWTDNGKLRVESKEKMAKEGMRSPDRADALLGAIGCGARMSGAVTGSQAKAASVGRSPFGGDVVTGW